jgi:hypothetical protein
MTKEEISQRLAQRKTQEHFKNSTWADLVTAIQSYDAQQRANFVGLLTSGETRKAGVALQKILFENAKGRARTEIDTLLADDTLNLTEISSILR